MNDPHASYSNDAGFGWVFNHLPAIFWHRRYYVVATFLTCLIAATVAAFALPTVYRSSATLLVEPQDLPENIAQDPNGGAIGERIAKIRERVLSRGDLIGLIEQADLYPEDRQTKPMSQIIDKLRKDTSVAALASDIGKSNSASNVIAINMSFDYPDPVKAQNVMQSYVDSFLRFDSDGLEDQTSLATQFLEDQSAGLQSQIKTIENEITALKARNGLALSGGSSMPFLDTGSYSAQIVALETQNRELLRDVNRPAQRDPQLAAAEDALASALAQFSDSHPDVIAARERLIATRRLTAGTPTVNASAANVAQIQDNNAAIASLRAARANAVSQANASVMGQARAPAILEQAAQLENRAAALREQLRGVSDNLAKAKNSERMASEQRAERLSLVEPPNLPDTPQSPNRPLLIAIGALMGLILGFVLAMIVELISRPLRSPAQIEAYNIPVLGIVPNIENRSKRRGLRLFRREASVG